MTIHSKPHPGSQSHRENLLKEKCLWLLAEGLYRWGQPNLLWEVSLPTVYERHYQKLQGTRGSYAKFEKKLFGMCPDHKAWSGSRCGLGEMPWLEQFEAIHFDISSKSLLVVGVNQITNQESWWIGLVHGSVCDPVWGFCFAKAKQSTEPLLWSNDCSSCCPHGLYIVLPAPPLQGGNQRDSGKAAARPAVLRGMNSKNKQTTNRFNFQELYDGSWFVGSHNYEQPWTFLVRAHL